jgi:predicted DNA-binding transcriptional regulator AlpA
MESDEYIRISEAARKSGVPATTLYSAIAVGTLPHAVKLGLKVVRMSDVLRYKENTKPGRPPEHTPIPEDTSL